MDFNTDLVRFNDESLPQNFVAVAVRVENKEPHHAAILIRHQTKNYLHHFPGQTRPEVVEDFNEDGWYIYKIFEAINADDESEVGSFLSYCRRICERSQITYSYIMDGSAYQHAGSHTSGSGLPELATCVGFCINTLNRTLIDADAVVKLEDWDDSGLDSRVDRWAQEQTAKAYPDLDWSLYNAFKKRITPLEYLCTAFINTYPIQKAQVEEIKESVQAVVNDKF